jgi:hypothetical protein
MAARVCRLPPAACATLASTRVDGIRALRLHLALMATGATMTVTHGPAPAAEGSRNAAVKIVG